MIIFLIVLGILFIYYNNQRKYKKIFECVQPEISDFFKEITQIKTGYVKNSSFNDFRNKYNKTNNNVLRLNERYKSKEIIKDFVEEWGNLESSFKDYNENYFKKQINSNSSEFEKLFEYVKLHPNEIWSDERVNNLIFLNKQLLDELNDFEKRVGRSGIVNYIKQINGIENDINGLEQQVNLLPEVGEFFGEINQINSGFIYYVFIKALKKKYTKNYDSILSFNDKYLLNEIKEFFDEWVNLENSFKEHNENYFNKQINNQLNEFEKLFKEIKSRLDKIDIDDSTKDLIFLNKQLLNELNDFEKSFVKSKIIGLRDKLNTINNDIKELKQQINFLPNIKKFLKEINTMQCYPTDILTINDIENKYGEIYRIVCSFNKKYWLDETNNFIEKYSDIQINYKLKEDNFIEFIIQRDNGQNSSGISRGTSTPSDGVITIAGDAEKLEKQLVDIKNKDINYRNTTNRRDFHKK